MVRLVWQISFKYLGIHAKLCSPARCFGINKGEFSLAVFQLSFVNQRVRQNRAAKRITVKLAPSKVYSISHSRLFYFTSL